MKKKEMKGGCSNNNKGKEKVECKESGEGGIVNGEPPSDSLD